MSEETLNQGTGDVNVPVEDGGDQAPQDVSVNKEEVTKVSQEEVAA